MVAAGEKASRSWRASEDGGRQRRARAHTRSLSLSPLEGTARAHGGLSWTESLAPGTTATPADAPAHPLTLASSTRHFYPLAPVNHHRWARLWVQRHQHSTLDRLVPANAPRSAVVAPKPALFDLDASLPSTATSSFDAIAYSAAEHTHSIAQTTLTDPLILPRPPCPETDSAWMIRLAHAQNKTQTQTQKQTQTQTQTLSQLPQTQTQTQTQLRTQLQTQTQTSQLLSQCTVLVPTSRVSKREGKAKVA
ncbi:hypothetical protein OF846_000506 [Rhodotorula toruloides]|nr:hypothetical protein OF846_000506 [Rhodotorula toruloides]